VTGAEDATAAFFDKLSRHGHEPMLENASGTVRFDLTDDAGVDRWLLTVDHGDVGVSRSDAGGGCVVYADRAVFNDMIDGEVNGMAAMLRGAIRFEGDTELIVLVRRLFRRPLPAGRNGGPS
jgi:putative sterol carrier protein